MGELFVYTNCQILLLFWWWWFWLKCVFLFTFFLKAWFFLNAEVFKLKCTCFHLVNKQVLVDIFAELAVWQSCIVSGKENFTCNNRFSMISLTLKQKGGTILQLKPTIHVIIIPAVNKYIPTVVRRGCLIVQPVCLQIKIRQ